MCISLRRLVRGKTGKARAGIIPTTKNKTDELAATKMMEEMRRR